MTAILLTVGDELLIGQTVNTNAAWIGERLSAVGVVVRRAVTVSDEPAEIRRALRQSLADADVVIATGGLGPTHDDVTKKAIADELGRPLRLDESVLDDLRRAYAARNRPMAERNRVQAEVPAGFTVLRNRIGTAPGLWFEEEVDGRRRALAILPGVPSEMKGLMTEEVLPRVVDLNGEADVVQKTLLTVGRGEADLADSLGDLDAWLGPRLRLAFLPSYGVVRLRITALGTDRAGAGARLAEFEAFVRARVGELIFGEGADTLEAAVGRMLRARGLTLATAESCTGGLLADRITNVPGSSSYYCGGMVVYGNAAKVSLLGVDDAVLAEAGAVSERVARQLAAGARQRLGADLAVATTGIAGPGGGTPEKPVGTVWLGYADANGTHAVRLQFVTDRLLNKRLSVTAALNLVRRQLLRLDPAPRGADLPSADLPSADLATTVPRATAEVMDAKLRCL